MQSGNHLHSSKKNYKLKYGVYWMANIVIQLWFTTFEYNDILITYMAIQLLLSVSILSFFFHNIPLLSN